MLGRHGFITWIPRHAVTRLNTGGGGSGVEQIIGRSLCWLIKSAAHNKDYLYFGDLRIHLIFRLRVYYKYTRFWNTNLSTNSMHQNNFQYHKKICLAKEVFLFIVCHLVYVNRAHLKPEASVCLIFCHWHFLYLNLNYYNLMKAKI